MSLLGTNRDTGFDINALADINVILEKEVLPKYKHLLDDTKVSVIDINVLLHQTPGGMLSNLVNQLRDMDALDKIEAQTQQPGLEVFKKALFEDISKRAFCLGKKQKTLRSYATFTGVYCRSVSLS